MRWLSGAVLLLTLMGCDRLKAQPNNKDGGGADSAAPVASAPSEETPAEAAQKAPNLAAALAIARPHMIDEANRVDEGTQLLVAWAAKSMKLADVNVRDETNLGLVGKDPEGERGKRMCVSGPISDISVEHTDIGTYHVGTLGEGTQLIRFFGVGSSGTLVPPNRARFCGVVTGRFDFLTNVGAPSRAVKVVGMFDIPQNREGGDPKPFIPNEPPGPTVKPIPTPPPFPTPTPTPVPRPNNDGSFDRGSAAAALGAVDLSPCRGLASGPGHVTVTFIADGSVSSAVVDSGSFVGTPAASCVAARYRLARVRAFIGPAVRVGKSFNLGGATNPGF